MKKLLSLLLCLVLCLSTTVSFAMDEVTVEQSITQSDISSSFVDYSDLSNWALWNEGENKPADLFIVCPTVDLGEDGNMLADIESEDYRFLFTGALNMELGLYSDIASIYAPFYRQITFPVAYLSREDQEQYLAVAYEDVKNAFLYYSQIADPDVPLILAGFSQGSDMIIRLMKDLFDDPKYANRLVAAYCIGWRLTEDELKDYPHLVPAANETDTGVIITFNTEAEDISSSLIVAETDKTVSINPLNWKTDSTPATKEENKGACFIDYDGSIKEEIPALTGAYIDEERGTLKVTDVEKADYPGVIFEDGIYHLYDYQFFFRNLQENVGVRLNAFNEKKSDTITVYYKDEVIEFDVEPIIEDGRTLVPFRAIFEAMGCAVDYSADESGKQTVFARRGDDSLSITIGENALYFNGEKVELDVPAKIVENRTLVPVRAISETFECEVFWNGDKKTVSICPPAECFYVIPEVLSETVTDKDGNVLIEAVAYYPTIKNELEISFIDEMNDDFKTYAVNFINRAKDQEADALLLSEQMGKDTFSPLEFELTFETDYNIYGTFSFTNYGYVNLGGAHPTTEMESFTYNVGMNEELPISGIIDEDALGEVSLRDYIYDLFAKKLKEMGVEPDADGEYRILQDELGSVQCRLNKKSAVLYFNPGVIAPYAAGIINVQIPFDATLFGVDMSHNEMEGYTYEAENYTGLEWKVIDYSKDKLTISESYKAYAPEEIINENFPVGMTTISALGKEKGNAYITIAFVENGKGKETAQIVNTAFLYVDENNKITIITESDDVNLLFSRR